jgi:pilus assembly protein CpaE
MTRFPRTGVVVADPGFRQAIAAALARLGAETVFAVSGTVAELAALPSSRPDVLILDFGRPDAAGIAEEFRLSNPRGTVVGAHSSADPDLFLLAIRTGARDFLYPPLDDAALSTALTGAAETCAAHGRGGLRAATVGFLSVSGGCGATTAACHLAAELARLDLGAVLLADFDLATGMAGFWFRTRTEYSLVHAARSLDRLDENCWKSLITEARPRLHVLAAPAELPLRPAPESRQLTSVLRFARGGYDWVVADLGQGLTDSTVELMSEMDSVFLVATPEVAALYQARRVSRALLDGGRDPAALKLILSRVRKDQDPSNTARLVGIPVEAFLPAVDAEIDDAHAEGRLLAPSSGFSQGVARIAARLAGVTPTERPSRFAVLLKSFRTQPA